MEIADLSSELYCGWLHEGVIACSVGWLGSSVPSTGTVAPHVLEALRHYSATNYQEDGFLGSHVCEICGDAKGHGEFWLEWDGRRYVLPMLVLHYCEVHDYLPPAEFLRALAARYEADAQATAHANEACAGSLDDACGIVLKMVARPSKQQA